jgi:leucyl/phenylalanyl-tRNA--protein transferase
VTVYRLGSDVVFPDPEDADPDGLLAVGGDLSPERLVLAYASGIFPWYEDGQPILWHSPDPRMVLDPSRLRVARSLERTLRRGRYEIRFDSAFAAVVEGCARVPRRGQDDPRATWITRGMRAAYVRLHELGLAHSIEAWRGDALCGGLYGVSLGAAFFGESMFARAPDASKVAFVALVSDLAARGFHLVDCQVHTAHLERFGAELWPRRRYLEALDRALDQPTRRGRW